MDTHRGQARENDQLHKQADGQQKRIAQLEQQVEQLKLELRVERQNKFATNQQANAEPVDSTAPPPGNRKRACKRGAPVGHPPWYRPTPTKYDELVEVEPPGKCPFCGGEVRAYAHHQPYDHLQEDLIDNAYRVVLFRHVKARCRQCRRWVNQPGQGEILGARIGPRARAIASFLRNDIGICLRKAPRAIGELLDLSFAPASLFNFEKMLAKNAEPVANDIAKKLGSSDGPVHANETYWTLDGKAQTLQDRINRHHDEWTVFLDDPQVPPTNNLAECALRPLVILRKLTFGHRDESTAARMAALMTVQVTAKRHRLASDRHFLSTLHASGEPNAAISLRRALAALRVSGGVFLAHTGPVRAVGRHLGTDAAKTRRLTGRQGRQPMGATAPVREPAPVGR